MGSYTDLKLFGNKESVNEFLRLSNNTMDEFNNLQQKKVKYRYLCWKYLSNIRNVVIPIIPIDSNLEAVLIECRILPHLEFIIRNAIIKLGTKWSHTIVCGNKNYDYMREICKSISPNIKIIRLNVDNLEAATTYNNLLATLSFWNMFKGDKILIHQEDSCVFKTNIDDFLEFDYIGAPWNQSQWLKDFGVKLAVGNGGFSLRTKQIMINIINQVPRPPNCKANEDVYFGRCMYNKKLGSLPTISQASLFSSEEIVNHASFGGHCFFNYDINWASRFFRDCIVPILKPNRISVDLGTK
jgi:hypothetical protein